jgi:hypothetical protein
MELGPALPHPRLAIEAVAVALWGVKAHPNDYFMKGLLRCATYHISSQKFERRNCVDRRLAAGTREIPMTDARWPNLSIAWRAEWD